MAADSSSHAPIGYLAIVLHAHLPFVRHPEYEESLEENWLFEAVTETYLPLLRVLEGLAEDGIDFHLTMSITPTLASMLLDPLLQSRYLKRLDKLIELSVKEIERTSTQPEFQSLALMYHQDFLNARTDFLDRYKCNLVEAFSHFQRLGRLEILASAATHGYLPLLSPDRSAVYAQVRVGVEHYEEAFGCKPVGFWLPECGYYPGVDRVLHEQGIRYAFLETHGITRAHPRPKNGVYAPICSPSGTAFFGRDTDSSKQVWSSVEGYPGDFDYREFYRDIGFDLDLEYVKPYIHPDGIRLDTGLKYFRITGRTDRKEVYVPEWALRKAELHAGNFMFNREKQIEHLAAFMDRKPIVVAPYDAELFGHWWFEGPKWLDFLFRKIAREQKTIRAISPSEYLREYPDHQIATPAVSSWGDKGFHETWINEKNDWIYPHLHEGAASMQALATSYPNARGVLRRALNQAARELQLAQASDWAFMIYRGTMTEYATKRTKTHLLRLRRLKGEIEEGVIDEQRLAAIESQNNLFPRIDYRWFR